MSETRKLAAILVSDGEAFRNVIAAAWRGIQGQPSEYPTLADGLRSLRLVEAAKRSARERRAVPVDTRSDA